MDWIANMPGPQFLGFYAAVIVVTLGGAYLWMRSGGRDDSLDPLVSTSPDPYEMAYLRGGDDEVAKLLLIELARRGYIQERTGTALRGGRVFLRQTDSHPSPALLPAGHRAIFELVGKEEQSLRRLLRSLGFRKALADVTNGFRDKMSREGFVVSGAKRLKVFLVTAGLIFGLGGYKLTVALAKGRYNVLFLIVLSAIALFVLLAIIAMRLTSRGGKYLRQTQEAYRGETSNVVLDPGAADHGSMLLHVGLFGAPILLGTAAAGYATMLGLDPNRRYGASGCSSGCGGGGCGGDGGGGGCGGGCGGCGGE